MFAIDATTLLGIVARVAVIYVACMMLLRVFGRHEVAQLSQMDLLTMLLISETVSPALTGGDQTLTGGIAATATLFALGTATSAIAFRSRRAERILQGSAAILIEDGRVDRRILRKYRISDEDLRSMLHQNGMLHVAEVKRAYIEADGEITMIKKTDFDDARRSIPKLSRAAEQGAP
jgi:uncharacterized membrane protein YcaP (DUF421 family)